MGRLSIEDKLWVEHDQEGLRRFGTRWRGANIGWFASTDCICSKVYGKPCIIFTTIYQGKGVITHQEEPHGAYL